MGLNNPSNATSLTGARLATAATDFASVGVVADTNDRFVINADGSMEWGSGAAAADLLFDRSAAKTWRLRPGTGSLTATDDGSTGIIVLAGGDLYLRQNGAANTLHLGWDNSNNEVVAVEARTFRFGTANVRMKPGATTSIGLPITLLASQSADAIDVFASDNTTKLFGVTKDGAVVSNSGAYAGATATGGTISYGTGAPNNANGVNGDLYCRVDGGALTTIYQRRAGAWTGIV